MDRLSVKLGFEVRDSKVGEEGRVEIEVRLRMALTCIVCLRRNDKTSTPSVVADERIITKDL